ncbi:MAG: tetratricopeptide repeat protein [Magnetococcus sp. DMHC-8]
MKIISFFSFKGGVGRTALLVNLAAYWASMGRVVAVVDMDLAAPGVSYSPLLEQDTIEPGMPPYGMNELLLTYYQEKTEEDPRLFGFAPPARLLRRLRPPDAWGDQWPRDGAVLVLPAGKMHFQPPSWLEQGLLDFVPPRQGRTGETVEEKSWRAFARLFRQDMEEYRLPGSGRAIDLLLIDCRTGWPELLDLSLGYLADSMVLVSGINQQNQAGLRHTLESLRRPKQGESRLPFGEYGKTLTVVFSPMPAHIHDDPDTLQALTHSQAILKEYCLPPPDEQQRPESLPPVFTLPYTTRLLQSDAPLYPSGGVEHPYIRVLLDVARRLQPDDPAEAMQETARELVRVGSKRAPPETAAPAGETMVNLLRFTRKWYWPWFDREDDPQAAGWRRMTAFVRPGDVGTEAVDVFLDGLSFSIAMDREEKKDILIKFKRLSDWQRRELVRIFDNERQKMESLEGPFLQQLVTTLYKSQTEWFHLMLGEEADAKPLRARLASPLARSGKDSRNLSMSPLDFAWDKEKDYRAAQSLTEQDAAYWCLLGNQLWDDQPAEAEAAYRRAIAMDETYARPWNGLGRVLANKLNRPEEAEAAYRRAIELDAKHAISWNNLGVLLIRSRCFEESESALRRAIELDDQWSSAWHNLGYIMQELNRFSESEAAYRRAIELDGEDAEPWNNLGNVLWKLNRFAESEAAYRRAIALDETSVAWHNLGLLLQHVLHRPEEAEAALRHARALKAAR